MWVRVVKMFWWNRILDCDVWWIGLWWCWVELVVVFIDIKWVWGNFVWFGEWFVWNLVVVWKWFVLDRWLRIM